MRNQNFIDRDKLYNLLDNNVPTQTELNDILNKARKLKGLNLNDVAKLLCVEERSTAAALCSLPPSIPATPV